MNKNAFLEGYSQKTAEVDSAGTDTVVDPKDEEISKIIETFRKNPKVFYSNFAMPAGAILGAGLGGLYGYKTNKQGPQDDNIDRALVFGTMGSLGGGLLGSIVRDRLRWPEAKKMVQDISAVQERYREPSANTGRVTYFLDMIKKLVGIRQIAPETAKS